MRFAPTAVAASTRLRREVALRRLAATGVHPATGTSLDPTSVVDVVGAHLAMQAQDLASGLWSVGVRTGASAADVRAAMDRREITRSWPMRGTLHLMATRDVRWMLRLLGERGVAQGRTRRRALGIDEQVTAAARDALTSAILRDGPLTREASYAALAAAGIDPAGQRGIHLLGLLCQQAVLCQGPPAGSTGNAPTFVVLDDWAPKHLDLGREEGMARLAASYVRTHGPVTVTDFAGWMGHTLGFAREAVALAGDALEVEEVGGQAMLVHRDAPAPGASGRVQLLPGFDEYVLGYKDRSVMMTREQEALVVPGGNGVFLATLVVGGLVAGTWTRRVRGPHSTPRSSPLVPRSDTSRGPRVNGHRVEVTVDPWSPLSAPQLKGVVTAASGYGDFLGLETSLTWAHRSSG